MVKLGSELQSPESAKHGSGGVLGREESVPYPQSYPIQGHSEIILPAPQSAPSGEMCTRKIGTSNKYLPGHPDASCS